MDHAEIEEQQVVDRYLMGTLEEADAARFEEHCLGCPQCLDELELAQRMQGAARFVASEDASRLAATRGLAVVAWLARRGRFVQLAAMVFLVALLPAASLLRQSSRPPAKAPPERGAVPMDLAPQPGTPIISLRPRRGSGQDTPPSLQLDLPPVPRWLVFSVELEPPLLAAYRVVLRRSAAGEELWRVASLEPSASGRLNVSFHTSTFEDGDYLLVVDAVTPDGGTVLVGRYPFRVVHPPAV